MTDLRFTHAILDFDGVVADTEAVFAVFDCDNLNEVLKAARLPPDLTPSFVRTLAGNSGKNKLRIVADKHGFDPAPYEETYIAQRRANRKTLFADKKVPLATNISPFIEKMADRIGVATNKYAAKLYPDMKAMKIDDWFSVVVTADPPLKRKPAPDILLQSLEKLNARPETTIYVGDNVLDIEAAKKARVIPVGFVIDGLEYNKVRAEKLAAAGARLVIDDFSDLLRQHII